MSRKGTVAALVLGAALLTVAIPAAQATPTNVRLTNDNSAYVSDYTLATGQAYTDDVLTACSQSRGRQNEPAIAVDPRNTNVVVGSSNDYCPVFNADGSLLGLGDIWLGYYRSENSGTSFTSSLVPGYIGDTSPYAALARVRTADSGDPVLAWDNHGRLFAGSESSGDRAGSAKTFGDVWVGRYVNSGGGTINDGKQFAGSIDVGTGSSAPNILGKFNDKTAIEVDRTGGACDGNVYFAWARFTGNSPNGFNSSVYFVRSTDHGATFSQPLKISQTVHDIQFPDISVTGDGHVYVTYREFADVRSNTTQDSIAYNVSTDCGSTFSAARQIVTFEPYDPTDIAAPNSVGTAPGGTANAEQIDQPAPGSVVGDCGDAASACASGYLHAWRHADSVDGRPDRHDARLRVPRLRPVDPGYRGPERDDVRLGRFRGPARQVPQGCRQPIRHLFLPPRRDHRRPHDAGANRSGDQGPAAVP